ncbi:MAG TPA: tetratricopeptide repeat protein [Bryobacteraceae bacterium]
MPRHSRFGFLAIGFVWPAILLGAATPPSRELLLAGTISTLQDSSGAGTVVLWNELGRFRQSRSDIDEAEQAFRRALELDQRLGAPSKIETAVVLNNLGTVGVARRDYAGAEAWFRQSYALLSEHHLLETPTAGSVLSNLALDLQQQGRYAEAKPFYERAFAAFRAARQETGLEFAKLLINAGEFSFETGDFRDAVEKHRRAVAVEAALPFVAAYDRAYALNRLALALGRTDGLEEARALLQKASDLVANPAALEQSAKLRVEIVNNLSGAERRSGRLAAAHEHAQEALRLASHELAPVDPLWAGLWNNFGMIALAENDLRAAKDYYEKSAAAALEISGRSSARYAAALSNLGTIESRQGRHGRAQSLWKTALAINEASLGPEHPQVASDLSNLAAEAFYAKKYREAIGLYQRAAAIQERSLGEQNKQMAATWRNLAIAYYSAKQYRDAQVAYARAIHAFEISAGPGSLDLLDCLKRNADVLRKLDRFAEAEQTEVRATRIEVENAIRAGKQG